MKRFVRQEGFREADDQACRQVLWRKVGLRLFGTGVEGATDKQHHGKNGSASRPSSLTVLVSFLG